MVFGILGHDTLFVMHTTEVPSLGGNIKVASIFENGKIEKVRSTGNSENVSILANFHTHLASQVTGGFILTGGFIFYYRGVKTHVKSSRHLTVMFLPIASHVYFGF